MTTQELLRQAKAAKPRLATLTSQEKNQALLAMAQQLQEQKEAILQANQADMQAAQGRISQVMLDRLALTEKRIDDMAEGIRQVTRLPDPVGRSTRHIERPSGIVIDRLSVPLGVVAIIYESRPNVTSDAASLCLKAGNAVILRGGKEAIRSNRAVAAAIRAGLVAGGLPIDAVQLVEDTSRETDADMMRLSGYLDVLIPRGGAGLIRAVVQQATVPVIETGVGNCHVYIDRCLNGAADYEMAAAIVENAKAQRPSVCNAIESLLVHQEVAQAVLPRIQQALAAHDVTIYGCDRTREILGESILPATETEYATEFLDYKIAVKVVDSLEEAIAHIAKYGTKHSECIVTRSLDAAEQFQREVDAAAVYVNASTRFTDGGEFGYGAEIGISTQKLHARGPMGLQALTTIKYLIRGNGQIRE